MLESWFPSAGCSVFSGSLQETNDELFLTLILLSSLYLDYWACIETNVNIVYSVYYFGFFFPPFRCLQTNGTKGCPKCFKSSMKPGFVWSRDCVCASDLQTQHGASQAADWSERSRRPHGCAEESFHCSAQRMLNWTQSVAECGSEDTIKASISFRHQSEADRVGTTDKVLQFKISWRAHVVSDDRPFVAAFKREMDRLKNICSLVRLLFYTLDLFGKKWRWNDVSPDLVTRLVVQIQRELFTAQHIVLYSTVEPYLLLRPCTYYSHVKFDFIWRVL